MVLAAADVGAADDYERVESQITAQRATWQQHLDTGLTDLTEHLAAAGYTVADTVPEADARLALPGPRGVTISARLKGTKGIVAKMRRFGEPLRGILDIWGYRRQELFRPKWVTVGYSPQDRKSSPRNRLGGSLLRRSLPATPLARRAGPPFRRRNARTRG